jgi:Uma2 family endonuclease
LLARNGNVTFFVMNQLTAIHGKSGRLKLTVEDFLLLDKKGAFDAYNKVELIDGEIWIVSPQLNRHSFMLADLSFEIGLALRAMKTDLRLSLEVSTRISDFSLPQPDFVVSTYKGDELMPLGEVALIVEVSATTLRTDLGRKLRLFAEAGVPEYWVVDLRGRKLHQMWSPEGKAYREKREVALGEVVEAQTIVGLRVAVPKT